MMDKPSLTKLTEPMKMDTLFHYSFSKPEPKDKFIMGPYDPSTSKGFKRLPYDSSEPPQLEHPLYIKPAEEKNKFKFSEEDDEKRRNTMRDYLASLGGGNTPLVITADMIDPNDTDRMYREIKMQNIYFQPDKDPLAVFDRKKGEVSVFVDGKRTEGWRNIDLGFGGEGLMDLRVDKSKIGQIKRPDSYEEIVDEVKDKPRGTTLLTGMLLRRGNSKTSAGSLMSAAQKYAPQLNNTSEETVRGAAKTSSAEQKPQWTATLSDPSKRSPFTNRVIGNLNRDKAAASKAIPLLNGLRDWESREINRDIPLNTTPEGYKALSDSRTDFRKEEDKYSDSAKKLVSDVVPDIEKAAAHYGVPEEVIAGAMLDENTRHGWVDKIQDFDSQAYSKKWAVGVKDRMNLKKMEDYVNSGKTDTVSYSKLLHPAYASDEVKKIIRNNNTLNKIFNHESWDVGPYNIGLSTGYEIFKKEVLSENASGPLKEMLNKYAPNGTDEEKWEVFRERGLNDPAGAAYVVGAVIQEAYETLAPYTQNATPEEQAALAVTYYKQGFGTMFRNYTNRISNKGKITDMNAGEGMRMVHEESTIENLMRNFYIEKAQTEAQLQEEAKRNAIKSNIDDLPFFKQ